MNPAETPAPARVTVSDIIAHYRAAFAVDDHAAAAKFLELLEQPVFLNAADWETIEAFFTERKFDARLELLTKRYVKATAPTAPKPYCVLIKLIAKSGRIAEASAFLKEHRKIFAAESGFNWDYVNLLFETGNVQECLTEVQRSREVLPEHIGYAVVEVRALWTLKHRLAAKTKFKQLAARIGDNAANWQWFMYLAREMGDLGAADMALGKILALVESGHTPVNPGMVVAFNHAGDKAGIIRLIRCADPARCETLPELQEMFETALHFGNSKIALKFGEAILAQDPENRLKPKIADLAAGRGFLMA